jgi:pre-mRNA-splicing helicase BRR2
MISDFLSGLVEESVDALLQSGMISEEGGEDVLSAGDLGLIASYYNVRTATVEMMRRSTTAQSKRKQLIELICHSSEFSFLAMNPDESPLLIAIANTLKLGLHESQFANQKGITGDPHAKAQVLLYGHFNRIPLTSDLQSELDHLLPIAHRLVLALVDTVSTCGWLQVALSAMEIAPMLVQAVVPSASPLLQLPHFDLERCEQASASFKVSDIIDVLSMEDKDRDSLLSGLTKGQIADVARACNMFPSINMATNVVVDGDEATVQIELEREGELTLDKRGTFVPVYAPLYPKEKEEGWWLVVGNAEGGVEDVKRVTIGQQKERVNMRISSLCSSKNYKLLLMSDSFIGCDQEEEIVI